MKVQDRFAQKKSQTRFDGRRGAAERRTAAREKATRGLWEPVKTKNQLTHVDSIHLLWEPRVKKPRLPRRFFMLVTHVLCGPLY